MNIIIYGVSGHQRKMLPASQPGDPPANGPFRPCRSHYDGRALSLLVLSPATRKLSSTLSTHSIRNAGETARADAFKTNASCLSASRWSGWLAGWLFEGISEGDEAEHRETKRVECQKGNIFDCSCRTPYVRRPLVSPCISMSRPNISS